MGAMDAVLMKLREHASPSPSRWRKEAEFRQANMDWLNQSRLVALKLLSLMRQSGISRFQLAEKIGINQECLNNLLKGKNRIDNITLSKIQQSLDI